MILVFLLNILLSPLTFAAEEEHKGWVTATVAVRNDLGTVYCRLYTSKDGFPDVVEKSTASVSAKPKDKKAVCQFTDLVDGEYAVSIFHDEKDLGKLEKDTFGIPKQGVGTSRNAKMRWGPPKFEDAKFQYDGKATQLEINTQYR